MKPHNDAWLDKHIRISGMFCSDSCTRFSMDEVPPLFFFFSTCRRTPRSQTSSTHSPPLCPWPLSSRPLPCPSSSAQHPNCRPAQSPLPSSASQESVSQVREKPAPRTPSSTLRARPYRDLFPKEVDIFFAVGQTLLRGCMLRFQQRLGFVDMIREHHVCLQPRQPPVCVATWATQSLQDAHSPLAIGTPRPWEVSRLWHKGYR